MKLRVILAEAQHFAGVVVGETVTQGKTFVVRAQIDFDTRSSGRREDDLQFTEIIRDGASFAIDGIPAFVMGGPHRLLQCEAYVRKRRKAHTGSQQDRLAGEIGRPGWQPVSCQTEMHGELTVGRKDGLFRRFCLRHESQRH